jgi:trimeric autotransporter adhesin
MRIKHPRLLVSCLTLGFIAILSLGATGCSSKPATTATLSSITIVPASPSNLPVGYPQVFIASGTYSDGRSGVDLTSKVTWTSSDTSIATISAAGTATALAVGSTKITATLDDIKSQTVTLTVIPATPAPTTTTTTTTP